MNPCPGSLVHSSSFIEHRYASPGLYRQIWCRAGLNFPHRKSAVQEPRRRLQVVDPLRPQFIFYRISICIYNIFLHPLCSFPGPVTSAASTWPKIRHALRGDVIYWIVDLHAKFGEVVRVSPNELSFSSADAWKDIYGHGSRLSKDPLFYKHPGDGVADIVNSNTTNHARMRKIFAHAFSDSALKKQEPLFLTYVDVLVQKLRQLSTADPEHKFNMVDMYNFTTFDIMGDLTFGEPLQMLADASYHPWVAAIFANFKFGTYLHCIRNFPTLETLLLSFIPQSLKEKQRLHNEFSVARVNKRIQEGDTRPDIWGLVLKKNDESGLTKSEMYANANLFMIGGTETTATLLCGLTYYLLRNPAKLKQLTDEIRDAFESEDSITIERLQRLKYLHACVEEGLRMYPPISNGLPRIVPPTGAQVGSIFVPPQVSDCRIIEHTAHMPES